MLNERSPADWNRLYEIPRSLTGSMHRSGGMVVACRCYFQAQEAG